MRLPELESGPVDHPDSVHLLCSGEALFLHHNIRPSLLQTSAERLLTTKSEVRNLPVPVTQAGHREVGRSKPPGASRNSSEIVNLPSMISLPRTVVKVPDPFFKSSQKLPYVPHLLLRCTCCYYTYSWCILPKI